MWNDMIRLLWSCMYDCPPSWSLWFFSWSYQIQILDPIIILVQYVKGNILVVDGLIFGFDGPFWMLLFSF